MDPSFFHRGRDQRFARLLDGQSVGTGEPGTADPDLTGYAELADDLRRIRDFAPTPAPEFRASLRAALIGTAVREGIGRTAEATDADLAEPITGTGGTRRFPLLGRRHRGSRRARRTRGAIIAGLAAGTLALSGISAASGDAMPGDALYSVKRSNEDVRLRLAGSDISRGQLKLEFAKTRMVEAGAQVRDAHPGTGLADLLDAMDADLTEGVRLLTTAAAGLRDTSPLDVVDGFVTTQQPSLLALRDASGGVMRGRAEVSVALLDQIRVRSGSLRTTLSCGAAPDSADALGPRPGACGRGGGTPSTGR